MLDWLKKLLGIKPKKRKGVPPPPQSIPKSGELKFLFEMRVWSGPEGSKSYQAFAALSPIGTIAVEEDKPGRPLWICEVKDLMRMYHYFGYAENAQEAMKVCQKAYASGHLHKYNQKCGDCILYKADDGQRCVCTLGTRKCVLRYDTGCSNWAPQDSMPSVNVGRG